MNKFSKNLIKFLAAHFLVYVLFTQLAMPGLVLCLGPDGHVAVEKEVGTMHHHPAPDTLPSSLLPDNHPHDLAGSGDCIDISLDHESGVAKTNQNKQSIVHDYGLNLLSWIALEKDDTYKTEYFPFQNVSLSSESAKMLFTTVLLI